MQITYGRANIDNYAHGGIHKITLKGDTNYFAHEDFPRNDDRDIALIYLEDKSFPLPESKASISIVNSMCLIGSPKFLPEDGQDVFQAGYGITAKNTKASRKLMTMNATTAYKHFPNALRNLGFDPNLSFAYIKPEPPFSKPCYVSNSSTSNNVY